MKKLLFLILILFSTKICSFEHFLTVCAIFRDDAPYLKEWIEFHLEQGVEHFYLYNNLSKDDYQKTLKPFIDNGVVSLKDWPYEHTNEENWQEIQCDSYMDCVERIRETSEWCAFIDTDEFLFSPIGKLSETLNRYRKYNGVIVNWVLYGTSNVEKVPSDERIVDYLVMRAPLNHQENRACKSIAKPKNILCPVTSHYFLYKKGYAVNENKKERRGWVNKDISVKYLRINHYRTRDVDFFKRVKMSRSKNWVNGERLYNIELLNSVHDPILKKG